MIKIFSSLKSLGLNYEDDIELYTKKEDKYDEETKDKKSTKIDINTLRRLLVQFV